MYLQKICHFEFALISSLSLVEADCIYLYICNHKGQISTDHFATNHLFKRWLRGGHKVYTYGLMRWQSSPEGFADFFEAVASDGGRSIFAVCLTPVEQLNILNQDVKSRILRGRLTPNARHPTPEPILIHSSQVTSSIF